VESTGVLRFRGSAQTESGAPPCTPVEKYWSEKRPSNGTDEDDVREGPSRVRGAAPFSP